MSRILAETFHSIEDINHVLDHPDVKFSSWRCVGRVKPDIGGLTEAQRISKRQGLYIVAFEYCGAIYPFYAGMTVGKDRGFRHRISSCEFNYKQQKKSVQGPSRVYQDLVKMDKQDDVLFYVSVCELEDTSMIRTYEKDVLLRKLDFLANKEDNGNRRLDVLPTIFAQGAPVREEEQVLPVRVSPFAEVFKLLAEVDEHIVRISHPTISEPTVEVEELIVEEPAADTLLEKVAKAARSGASNPKFPETVAGLHHGETVVVSSKPTRTSGFCVPHEHELQRSLIFVKTDTLLGFYDEDKHIFHMNARSLMKHYMKNPDSDAREHVYVERTRNGLTGWRALRYTIA